ncbi:SsrA-binding protein SmpB, partial [Dehalococcoidia bacterium]|nr:SsrA-binding protein SmpB [Dehalococcoidia bacterium]
MTATRESRGSTIASNRRARYDYEIVDTVEAGLVLFGTEIKSIRAGQVSLSDAYARPDNGELWLENAHIAAYASGNLNNHEPKRRRKLLLHRDQISRMTKQVAERGLTLVPLRLYLHGGYAKIELAVARGKKRFDKRRTIIDREREREARAAIK